MKILLADDDGDDCNFFRDALEKLPVSTKLSVVNDGEQLMQLLTNETTEIPDVLFLDINMPRKDGIECLAEIKSDPNLKDLPVIIFSTSKSKDTMGIVFKAGAIVIFTSPVILRNSSRSFTMRFRLRQKIYFQTAR